MTEEEKNVGKNESRNDKRWDHLYQLVITMINMS